MREWAGLDTYDRHDWKHWVDADGDCQDTRNEVLIEESVVPVTFKTEKHCKVKSGEWRCPYTGRVFTDPRDLDIDHMVPLKNAHLSGGHSWSADEREAYANDLSNPDHLLAVYKGANRSKADRSPDVWLPEDTGYRCAYARAWKTVKRRWNLSATQAEAVALNKVESQCAARGSIPDVSPSGGGDGTPRWGAESVNGRLGLSRAFDLTGPGGRGRPQLRFVGRWLRASWSAFFAAFRSPLNRFLGRPKWSHSAFW